MTLEFLTKAILKAYQFPTPTTARTKGAVSIVELAQYSKDDLADIFQQLSVELGPVNVAILAKSTPSKALLEAKMEVVKHFYEFKEALEKEAVKVREEKQLKAKAAAELEKRAENAFTTMSEEELKAILAK